MFIHQRVSFLAGLLVAAFSAAEFRQASAGAIPKTRKDNRRDWKYNQHLANRRGSKQTKK